MYIDNYTQLSVKCQNRFAEIVIKRWQHCGCACAVVGKFSSHCCCRKRKYLGAEAGKTNQNCLYVSTINIENAPTKQFTLVKQRCRHIAPKGSTHYSSFIRVELAYCFAQFLCAVNLIELNCT